MNPDIYSPEHAAAVRRMAERDRAIKVARSRAAQPRLRDNRKSSPTRAR